MHYPKAVLTCQHWLQRLWVSMFLTPCSGAPCTEADPSATLLSGRRAALRGAGNAHTHGFTRNRGGNCLTIGGEHRLRRDRREPGERSSGVVHGCYTNQALNGSHVFVLQDAGQAAPRARRRLAGTGRGQQDRPVRLERQVRLDRLGLLGLLARVATRCLTAQETRSAVGNNGDFYADTAADVLYGPNSVAPGRLREPALLAAPDRKVRQDRRDRQDRQARPHSMA